MVAAGCVAARQQAVPACGAAGTSGIVSRSRVAGRRRWRRRVGGGGVIHSMCTGKAEKVEKCCTTVRSRGPGTLPGLR